MSGTKYKDGKQYVPKRTAVKPKKIEDSVLDEKHALLLQKLNLLKSNIADEFLDEITRNKKIIERAIDLADLDPTEMLLRLAATELHLETALFLYQETFDQKQFLEDAYNKRLEKRLINAGNKTAGKAKSNSKFAAAKATAMQILDSMKVQDFDIFRRKMRAKYPDLNLSPNTLRNYFLEITGLKSTKKLTSDM